MKKIYRRLLLMVMQSKPYAWLLLSVIPYIRFTTYYTSLRGWKYQRAGDNEPTNPGLWDKVQKLTKGEIKSIKHDGKTIHGPNDGKGFTVFPCVPLNTEALTPVG